MYISVRMFYFFLINPPFFYNVQISSKFHTSIKGILLFIYTELKNKSHKSENRWFFCIHYLLKIFNADPQKCIYILFHFFFKNFENYILFFTRRQIQENKIIPLFIIKKVYIFLTLQVKAFSISRSLFLNKNNTNVLV